MTKPLQDDSSRFDLFFLQTYGSVWPELAIALRQPQQKVGLLNPFCAQATQNMISQQGTVMEHETLRVVQFNDFAAIEPIADAQGLLSHYNLDFASLVPTFEIAVQDNAQILDLCAAPGGKALAMIFRLSQTATFVLNDLSKDRLQRLRRVLKMYLPPSGLARVSVSHRDGGLFFKNYHDTFDAVLVDAPCSGERYLLEKPGGEEEWRPKRSQRLASRQMALLCSALHVLKDNGCLVYSTCSISPIENDQLVQRFLRKRKDQVVMTKSHFILPNPQKNIGPIYFARFRKSQHKNKLETALR